MPSTRSPFTVAAVVATALTVTVVFAGAPAAGAPPPEDVCGVCGSHFEAAVANAGGPDVTVERSRADVHVRENGSARVLARNALTPSAAAWVANNTDAVAHALAGTEAGLDESKHALSVRVSDDVATVSYVDETFGYRSFGGVVLADAFTRAETGWTVNAELFAVHAPDTYVVSSHGRGETTVAWNDSVDDAHVAFAPGNGPVPAAATRLALVAATAPAFLRGAAFALLPFAGALAVLFRAVDTAAEVSPDVDARTAGGAAAAAGGAVILALVAWGRPSLYFMLYDAVLLFTAVTAVAVGVAVFRGARSARSLSLAGVGVPLVGSAVAGFVGAFAHPAVAGWTIWRALTAGCLASQLGVFTVLGATRNRRRTSRWRRFAAASAPAAAVVALFGPTGVVLAWVPVLAVLAPLMYLLGTSAGRHSLRSV